VASSPSSDAGRASSAIEATLVAVGNLVFRHRNRMAPILLGVVVLLTRPRPFAGTPRGDVFWDVCGALVASAGQALRILVIGLAYIRRGGKHRMIAADTLVVDGIFAHARHPLYVGNFLLLTGLMMIWNAPGGYALLAVAGLALYAMARAEEAFLARTFGAAFADYCARVPRFIPDLRGIGDTLARFTFDWKRVVRKEYGTTFALVSCGLGLIAIQWVEWEGGAGLQRALLVLLPVWLLVAASWGAARWMKKTRRLVSPDRPVPRRAAGRRRPPWCAPRGGAPAAGGAP
jgi:protein-S-isoprenylcysteine O-methyltransferase Ste14